MKEHFSTTLLQDENIEILDAPRRPKSCLLRQAAEHQLFEIMHKSYSIKIYDIYDSRSVYSEYSLSGSINDKTMSLRDLLYVLDELGLLGSEDNQLEISDVIQHFSSTRPEHFDESLYWAEVEMVPSAIFDVVFLVATKAASKYLARIGGEPVIQEEAARDGVELSLSELDLDQPSLDQAGASSEDLNASTNADTEIVAAEDESPKALGVNLDKSMSTSV